MILTPRLKLQMPEVSTDNMSDGDNVLSYNYDLIDLNAHCRVVNALVDITDPFDGQHAHVLSTGINYIRKNGVWALFAEPVSAGGTGSKGTNQTTARTTIPGAETELMQITFTPETGKRYLIKGSASIGISAGSSFASCILKMRWATGTDVTTAGTLLSSTAINFFYTDGTDSTGTSSDYSLVVYDEIFPNNTTQLSVGLYIENTSGSSNVYSNPNGMGSGAGFVTYSNISAYDWGS